MTNTMKGLQSLHINHRIKVLEEHVEQIPEKGSNIFLDSSININRINDVASNKLKLVEDVLETISSSYFAYTTRTNLERTMDDSKQQWQIITKMEKVFSSKWPNFNDNATMLTTVSQDLKEIKGRHV